MAKTHPCHNNPCDSRCQDRVLFNCLPTDPVSLSGARLLSAIYYAGEQGQLGDDSGHGIITNIIAYGFTFAHQTCKSSALAEQVISLNCLNAQGEAVRANSNCALCKQQVVAALRARQALEDEAFRRNPNYQKQTLSDDVKTKLLGPTGDGELGACQYVCAQCVARGLDQNIALKVSETCTAEAADYSNAFTSGMQLQAETAIKQHKQALEKSGYELKTNADLQQLSVLMANTIKQITRTTVLNQMLMNAVAIQSVTITADSTSVVVQNVEQGITLTEIASMVSKLFSETTIKNSINYNVQQQVIQTETNFNDLVRDLEHTVNTLDDLLVSTIGKIMITIVVIILAVMMVFASFFFFKPDFLFGGSLNAMLKS